jgi:hypothetical protein
MLNTPLTIVYANETNIGDKRRGGQSHAARKVYTPWKAEPFASGADAADHAMLHGGTWVLLIAARAGAAAASDLYSETNEELLRRVRKNVQQNILARARRDSHGFSFAD